MATKNYENGIIGRSEVGSDDISSDILVTGDVYWVDSVNGNDSNAGTNRNSPLATLSQAITNATADNGDVIVIESGHTESLSSSLTISKDHIKIYGLGSGSNKPQFTVTAAIDGINLSGEGIELNNLRFPVGTTATNTSRVNIANDGNIIKNCDFLCGEYDLETITVATLVDDAKIEGCTFTISADGPDAAIEIEAADVLRLSVLSCSFDGGSFDFDNAAIYSTVAHKGFYYSENTLSNKASIIHTGSATGVCIGTISGDGSRVEV